MHRVRPGKERVKPACPTCGELAEPFEDNPAFPFCTERCQLLDLGRWLDADYRVPAEPVDPNDFDGDDA